MSESIQVTTRGHLAAYKQLHSEGFMDMSASDKAFLIQLNATDKVISQSDFDNTSHLGGE